MSPEMTSHSAIFKHHQNYHAKFTSLSSAMGARINFSTGVGATIFAQKIAMFFLLPKAQVKSLAIFGFLDYMYI